MRPTGTTMQPISAGAFARASAYPMQFANPANSRGPTTAPANGPAFATAAAAARHDAADGAAERGFRRTLEIHRNAKLVSKAKLAGNGGIVVGSR